VHQYGWRDRGQLPEDMALGRRWGQLRIVGYEQRQDGRKYRTYVICVCLCGEIVFSRPEHLRKDDVQSCGCLRKAQMRATALARWQAVKAGTATLAVGRPRKQPQAA
jgi:hypothetical protein